MISSEGDMRGAGGPGPEVRVHATAVALDAQRGVLILGPSGAGKSELALELMAFGAHLVSDDQVVLWESDGCLLARAPEAIRGMIEARGIGLLGAEVLDQARIVLVVDLGHEEPERLPPLRSRAFCGVSLPLVQARHRAHVGVSVLQWLKGGRRE